MVSRLVWLNPPVFLIVYGDDISSAIWKPLAEKVTMALLLILTGLLLTLTAAASIITARDLKQQREGLARLVRAGEEGEKKVEEAENHRKVVEGNRAMLNRLKTEKQDRIQYLVEELEELKEEVVEEYEITTKQGPDRKNMDLYEEEEKPVESPGA